MPKTQILGLKTFDILGSDKETNLYSVLSALLGVSSDSNMNKIDKFYELQKDEIELLKQKESIKTVRATLSSSSTELDFYTATSDITEYKDKMLILLSFSANNKQKTQININELGVINVKKINELSQLVELEANDIKKDINYLYQLNLGLGVNRDLILVGEDINGQLTKILSQIEDLKKSDKLKAPLDSPTFTGDVKGIDKDMVGLNNVTNDKQVKCTDVINDLSTGGAKNVLSAEQGKILNDNKVDKIAGKGLSTNDFTDELKSKYDGYDEEKEPKIVTKGTAFNKNFGTGHDDIPRGDEAVIASISKTYAELKTLKDGNQLKAGQHYLLTDYVTKYQQPVSLTMKTATETEPLLLMAISNNEFAVECYSSLYPDDIIYYDFDDNVCEDGSTPRNGFIQRRYWVKNEVNVPNDWRHILWFRDGEEYGTFSDADGNITDYAYQISIDGENLNWSGSKRQLANNVFKDLNPNGQVHNLTAGNRFYGNTFGFSCVNNTFGSSCVNNTFGFSCENNIFGSSCSYNTFGSSCLNNTFGSSCSYNTFGSNSTHLQIKRIYSKNVSQIADLQNKTYTNTIECRQDGTCVFWYLNNSNQPVYTNIP